MPEKTSSIDQDETVKRNKIPLYISAGIIIATVLSFFFIPGVHQFFTEAFSVLTSGNEQKVNSWVGQFGFWGPVVIILAMTVQMFLIVIPSPILIGVAILGYGPIWGSIIAVTAIFTASTVGYIVGSYFGPPFVTKILGHSSKQKVEQAIDEYGFWAVVVTRLNPFLSDDAISFVGGILKMGYWKFIGATLVGVIPLTALIAYLGQHTQQFKEVTLWISIVSILFLVVYIWWDKKLKNNV